MFRRANRRWGQVGDMGRLTSKSTDEWLGLVSFFSMSVCLKVSEVACRMHSVVMV